MRKPINNTCRLMCLSLALVVLMSELALRSYTQGERLLLPSASRPTAATNFAGWSTAVSTRTRLEAEGAGWNCHQYRPD